MATFFTDELLKLRPVECLLNFVQCYLDSRVASKDGRVECVKYFISKACCAPNIDFSFEAQNANLQGVVCLAVYVNCEFLNEFGAFLITSI
jgi:hypothetical protein